METLQVPGETDQAEIAAFAADDRRTREEHAREAVRRIRRARRRLPRISDTHDPRPGALTRFFRASLDAENLTRLLEGSWKESGPLRALFSKEVLFVFLNGVAWALVVGVISAAWFSDPKLGAVIAAAMVINLVTAAFAGVGVPLVLRRMNIDPALAGGVVLTTVTDVMGFLSFLGLATIVLLGGT